MKKCILLYGFNNFQMQQVKNAFIMRNFEVTSVQEEQYGWLIGELVGEYEIKEVHETGITIPGKMAVVSGVEESEMADVFELLTKTTGKLAYHKAVVTDTNKNWTSARLFMEVDREYREIKRMQKYKR
ncbi:MAG: DUF3783 domain-containing protein [Lachnospiraceae bacterium]|nr:DUF3783 domain-containing protein [Lachnospiraceae bacterium]